MSQLLPFLNARPQFETPNPPEPSLPPPKSINASRKTALLVENDESLLNFLRRCLNDEGYAVRTASNSEEGLRLYRDCAPFNVVLIDYCVPQRNGFGIDYLAPQIHGIGLAMAIREINPSQGIIIAALEYRNAGEVPRPRELMHIPLLTDISNFQLRGLLEKIEIDRAIEALTSSELLRLQQSAEFLVRGIGRAALGKAAWEDLLAEALLRTAMGAENTRKGRHWNKDVDFVTHLTGAMQSISNSWKRQFSRRGVFLASELVLHDAEGQEYSLLDNVASDDAAADQLLIETEEENRVLAMFKDDSEATQLLQGLLRGMKKNEIGLDKKRCAAAEKRIRLKLRGRQNGGNEHGR